MIQCYRIPDRNALMAGAVAIVQIRQDGCVRPSAAGIRLNQNRMTLELVPPP